MQKFLDGLGNGRLGGTSRSTPSSRKGAPLFQAKKVAALANSKNGKIEFATEEDKLSDDDRPENNSNTWFLPPKIRKIDPGSNENDERDEIATDESNNSNFIIDDDNTNRIPDDKEEISTDPLDDDQGNLSSANTSSFSSASSSSSSSSSSLLSSRSSFQPFSFLANLKTSQKGNTATNTVESPWIQAVNNQISSRKAVGQSKVPTVVSSSCEPFHGLLTSTTPITSVPRSHVNFVPGGISERYHHIVHQKSVFGNHEYFEKDISFTISIVSEHQPSIQGPLYCATCLVSFSGQEFEHNSIDLPLNGELCDIYFQTKGKPIGIGITVSVNSWRAVNLSHMRPMGRKVILCSRYAICGNSPITSSNVVIPKYLEPQPFIEEPNVPFRRISSQISSSLAMQCKKVESSDDSLPGTIEKVLYTNSSAFIYLLSLNQSVWELVVDGSCVFTEYKDLLYTSVGQTWSFCSLEVIGTRKVRDDERAIVNRWKSGCDTIFCRRCRPGVFTGIPIAPGSMLLTVPANSRGSAPDLMPPYVSAPLFTVFNARDYFSPNDSGTYSTERKRVSLIGYVYHVNKRDAEFWLSDVSDETGFLCFLRVVLRGNLAKQKTSCGVTKGSVVLLRDLDLDPAYKIAFADRLTQFEVFKKDARGYSFSGGVIYRPSSFAPQKLWAGKDDLLEEATLKACEINSSIGQASCHVPTFSSIPTLLSEISPGSPTINKIIAFSGTVTSVVKEYFIGVCSTCGKKMRKYEVPGETPIFTCEDCGSYEDVNTRVVVFTVSNSVALKVIGKEAINAFKSKCGVSESNEWNSIIGESFRDLTCIFYHRKGDFIKAELLI